MILVKSFPTKNLCYLKFGKKLTDKFKKCIIFNSNSLKYASRRNSYGERWRRLMKEKLDKIYNKEVIIMKREEITGFVGGFVGGFIGA